MYVTHVNVDHIRRQNSKMMLSLAFCRRKWCRVEAQSNIASYKPVQAETRATRFDERARSQHNRSTSLRLLKSRDIHACSSRRVIPSGHTVAADDAEKLGEADSAEKSSRVLVMGSR